MANLFRRGLGLTSAGVSRLREREIPMFRDLIVWPAAVPMVVLILLHLVDALQPLVEAVCPQ